MFFAKRLERKVDSNTARLVKIENGILAVGKRNEELAKMNAKLLEGVLTLERDKAALNEKNAALRKENEELRASLEAAKASAPGAADGDKKTSSALVDEWRNGKGAEAWS